MLATEPDPLLVEVPVERITPTMLGMLPNGNVVLILPTISASCHPRLTFSHLEPSACVTSNLLSMAAIGKFIQFAEPSK
ncbi:hypothetical protein [Sphingomonas solaris]|uniref:Uncharacterized protein n=1 Tax=Alterirhizorhabdus solaris TaxID=2529389 RepID=A0A558R983_9SPHN|nr:hypothetical protein [Sphingomonas solaris]TVV75937.1 hypothetical protein FOY91_05675 [Sphingomonas solaris]